MTSQRLARFAGAHALFDEAMGLDPTVSQPDFNRQQEESIDRDFMRKYNELPRA